MEFGCIISFLTPLVASAVTLRAPTDLLWKNTSDVLCIVGYLKTSLQRAMMALRTVLRQESTEPVKEE